MQVHSSVHPSIQVTKGLHEPLLAEAFLAVSMNGSCDIGVLAGEALAIASADGIEAQLLRVELPEEDPE